MKPGSANSENPIHDYGDGWYLIRGTDYCRPDEKKDDSFCVCGWGDTTETAVTSVGTFRFCRSRHGDHETFAKKYLGDMKILQEYNKQLKLAL